MKRFCAQDCANCHRRMAAYFCSVCNLFDDAGPEKKVFHCAQCGICRFVSLALPALRLWVAKSATSRWLVVSGDVADVALVGFAAVCSVGGRENFYHCVKCCGCYPHSLETKHKCLEGSMHRECPICLDVRPLVLGSKALAQQVTFDSLESVNVLPCGHVMHVSCFKEYLKHRNIVCPTCRTLMFAEDEMNGTADGSEDEEEEDSESEEDAEEDERLGAADDDSDSDSEVDTDSDASSTAADDAEHNVWPAGHRAV
ncbi:hypothetical protein BBJ28_00014149 [Nothophytophthora sp. Chile5]|nr:hypothetical protein BBJ28_00014149 [Nothophytophthora sp. Chile5]